jgi:hypothetical protein
MTIKPEGPVIRIRFPTIPPAWANNSLQSVVFTGGSGQPVYWAGDFSRAELGVRTSAAHIRYRGLLGVFAPIP